MEISIKLTGNDVELLTFRAEKTSDRQDQPLDLAGPSWPNAMSSKDAWQHHRWDMFFVDARVPIRLSDHSLRLYDGEREQYGTDMQLLIARFFVRPVFQNPNLVHFERQPTALGAGDYEQVEEAACAWFRQQPEHKQMVEWGLSAMRQMRDVLVLAEKFDAGWWGVFENNVSKEK